MATKKYELTKEYFFHGEFWHQLDDNKGRFSARIEYSPYHGLILGKVRISRSFLPKLTR